MALSHLTRDPRKQNSELRCTCPGLVQSQPGYILQTGKPWEFEASREHVPLSMAVLGMPPRPHPRHVSPGVSLAAPHQSDRPLPQRTGEATLGSQVGFRRHTRSSSQIPQRCPSGMASVRIQALWLVRSRATQGDHRNEAWLCWQKGTIFFK